MAKKQTYGNDSIKSLKGADRVRLRPAVIFGSDGLDGCQNDTVTRTATFFTYTQIGFNGNYLGREDKFSIRVYTEEDWAEKEQDDKDILLSSSAGRVYVLRILDDSMAESDEKTLQSGFEVLE